MVSIDGAAVAAGCLIRFRRRSAGLRRLLPGVRRRSGGFEEFAPDKEDYQHQREGD